MEKPARAWFRPVIVPAAREHGWAGLPRDLAAGITVGIIALPLAMALAIASGVSPVAGIVTAVVAGFIASLTGGSRVQITGPTAAFIPLVSAIVQHHGVADLIVCTIMAGVILIIMGATRMGGIIKFIPHPVTVGFTNGIAVFIMIKQLPDALGLAPEVAKGGFLEIVPRLPDAMPGLDLPSLSMALASILLIVFWPVKWGRRVPAYFVVVVLSWLAVRLFQVPVETIGTRFGGIPSGWPEFHWPDFSPSNLRDLIGPATSIAILAGIESLLSAVVADGMTEQRHDSNQELIGQGLANVAAPLFGGIPATGAIARTAANIRNGALTPVSGLVHALTLLVVLLAAAPLAADIPLPTLAAILLVVAARMGEWSEFAGLRQLARSDAVVFLTTFGLTVIFDLTVAIEVGMVLAAFLFIKRVSENTEVTRDVADRDINEDFRPLPENEVPPGVLVYRVAGALMFGAAEKLENLLQHAHEEPRVLILRMRRVISMDATAIHSIDTIHRKLGKTGRHLVLSGTRDQPLDLLAKSGLAGRIGRANIRPDIHAALQRAREILDEESRKHAPNS
jgi:SulP family sulfate permease